MRTMWNKRLHGSTSCQATVHSDLMRLTGQITSGQLHLVFFFLAVRQLTTELMRQVTVPAWATFLAVRQLTTELMRQVTVPV